MEKYSFGDKLVDAKEKIGLVNDVFDQVASKYDIMNDLMSGGMHRYWKYKFINMIGLRPDTKIIDVASGSGDIAMGVAKKTSKFKPSCAITMCDINQNMLDCGRDKMVNHGFIHNIDYVVSAAEDLATNTALEHFDYYTISFGMRNVTQIPAAIESAFKVLKSGGKFMCMEFSTIKQPLLAQIYEQYANHVIPKIGKRIVGNAQPYEYLIESIRHFPKPTEFAALLKAAGFTKVGYSNFLSGMVVVYQAIKP